MITLLTFWISAKHKQDPGILYLGTVIIDLGTISALIQIIK